ncbi:hypothetical protein ABG768_025940, partial [Culter alburnus]
QKRDGGHSPALDLGTAVEVETGLAMESKQERVKEKWLKGEKEAAAAVTVAGMKSLCVLNNSAGTQPRTRGVWD